MTSATEQQQLSGVGQRRLYSVTALQKMALGSGTGLVNWHCEQTAITAVDKRSTVEAMLRESGRDETIKWLVSSRWDNVDRARVRGTDVHKAAEAIALGIEPTIVPGTEPYVEQLVRWYRKWRPEFMLAEAPVYNVEHAYAGTCDGIMVLDGHRLLFDYKTTDKGPDARSRHPYSEAPLQIVAYARATEVGVLAEQRYDGFQQRYYLYDEAAQHEPMPTVDGALCIVISPFDCFAVPVSIGEIAWQAWLHTIAVARWQSEQWRNAFGSALDNVGERS
jgi:hypothetical protein